MEKSKQDGNKHFVQKRYFEALDEYNRGIESVSKNIINHLKIQAKEFLRAKSPSSALVCSIAVIRLDSSDVDALLLYAECLAHAGLLDAASLVCLQTLLDSKDEAREDYEKAAAALKRCWEIDAQRISDSGGGDGRRHSRRLGDDAEEEEEEEEERDRINGGEKAFEASPTLSKSDEDVEIGSDSDAALTRVWETKISLKTTWSDFCSVAVSLPDPDKEGPVIGTILSNAAACELALRQPHLAAASAAAALLFPASDAVKVKAAFRLCTALIQSCSFAQAIEAFDLAASVGVDVKELARLRESVTLRQREALRGDFDWECHFRWTKQNPGVDLDCAPFVGPVRIAQIPFKGSGLQATRNVKTGELLIVSHAYYACHRLNITHLMKGIFERVAGNRLTQFEDSKSLFFLTDGVHGRDLHPYSPFHVLSFPRFPLPLLPRQLLQLQHFDDVDDLLRRLTLTGNVDDVGGYLTSIREKIYAGVPTNPSSFKTTDEKLKFGEKLVGIVNTNMMHHAQVTCPWHVLESQEDSALSRYSTDGLWILPSFLNTGNATNVIATCVGDVLVCKAAKDIREGDELLINYTIEREWSKRQEFMEHHGIPMPPDPVSPLKGKVDQLKKIDVKLNEISNLMKQNRHPEALKSLNSLVKKNKSIVTLDLLYSEILFKKGKCRSLMGDSPSQVLPILLSALEAERSFRPHGSDYITLILQWMRFPNLKKEERESLQTILNELSSITYGLPFHNVSLLLDSCWT